MIEHEDPDAAFDSAVESIIQPPPPPEQPKSTPGESSPPRSGRGGARPGAGRPRKNSNGATASGPVFDPDRRESAPRKPIDPQIIAQLVRRADAVIVALCKTRPLDAGEIEEGGEVLAPLADHYLPRAITTPEGVALAWIVAAYGPRALEVWEDRQAAKNSTVPQDAADMPTPAGGAPPGAGFSDRDAAEALTLGYVAGRPNSQAA